MLNKTSKEWKKLPLWVRSVLWPVNNRKAAIRLELLAAGIAALFIVFIDSNVFAVTALICAFLCAGAIKWVDNTDLWEQNEG